MDDDVDTRDDWLDGRLKAAVRDAGRVPRRRLLLPGVAPGTPSRRPWLRRHGLVAGLVALNLLTGAAAFRVGLGASRDTGPTSPATSAATAPSGPSRAVLATVTLNTALRGDPVRDEGGLAVGAGSVWVASAGEGAVVRIDERTGRAVATIAVGAPGNDAGTASTIEGGFPSAVAADGGVIWATANAEHAIVRIDPATNTVVDRVTVGDEPTALAVSGDTVWVTSRPSGRLLEVDTRHHRVVASFATGTWPERVVVVDGSVWFVNRRDGTVSRLDVATGRIATTPPSDAYDYGYISVATDGSRVYGLDYNRGVVEPIDPLTLRPGPGIAAVPNGVALAIDRGTAWVVSAVGLVRIDLATGTPAAATPLPGGASVAAGDGTLWVLAGDRSQAAVRRLATGP